MLLLFIEVCFLNVYIGWIGKCVEGYYFLYCLFMIVGCNYIYMLRVNGIYLLNNLVYGDIYI